MYQNPAITVYLFFVFLSFGCIKEEANPDTEKPESLPYIDVYSDNSPFKQKIPDNPQIDINSDRYIERLKEDADENGFFISIKKWTQPVYFAGPNTSRYDFTLFASWAPVRTMKDVPIPDYAEPDPMTDGEMVVIDTINGCEYDFWQAKKVWGKWYAAWANAIPLTSNGIYEKGLSCRGSGFALLGGLLWPQELRKDSIGHALVFSYSTPKSGGPVPPATESDGMSDYEFDIPEGAIIQLNPNLDLNDFNLEPYEKTIAKALQQYGMICADVGGGVQIYAVSAISTKKNPYEGILPETDDYVYLNNIPVSEFRVLKLPPQILDPDNELVKNNCAVMEE